jgi:hypothetical protein
MAFRCYTKYVQLQFFRGASLEPVPPKASKHADVRYLDIHGDDDLEEGWLLVWIAQASNLPGEKLYEQPGTLGGRNSTSGAQ